jgi:nucleotide-binding universal stress UspA family protein
VVRVRSHCCACSTDPILDAESRRAQLLVLGHRGLGGVIGLLLGSVTVALAACAACPVVVVRGARPLDASPPLPVVVGVDSTPNSEAAIAFAFGAADARRAPLVAVHTWWDSLVDPALDSLLDWDAIKAAEREGLAERLAGWARSTRTYRCGALSPVTGRRTGCWTRRGARNY